MNWFFFVLGLIPLLYLAIVFVIFKPPKKDEYKRARRCVYCKYISPLKYRSDLDEMCANCGYQIHEEGAALHKYWFGYIPRSVCDFRRGSDYERRITDSVDAETETAYL